jgi:hypothetical protein
MYQGIHGWIMQAECLRYRNEEAIGYVTGQNVTENRYTGFADCW